MSDAGIACWLAPTPVTAAGWLDAGCARMDACFSNVEAVTLPGSATWRLLSICLIRADSTPGGGVVDFALSEEQQALRDLARDFAQGEIAPLAGEMEREQRHSDEIVKRCYELGLLHYGGGGLGSLKGCLVAEEFAVRCGGVEVGLYGAIMGVLPLLIAGTPELKEELLTPYCAGPNLAALCITEAGAGSDMGSIRSSALRIGDEYIIDGTKRFITNGGVASLYSVIAEEEPDLGYRGLSAHGACRHSGGL